MIKILVTGANGFVGKTLVPLLLKSGFHVRATSRSLTEGYSRSDNIEWVEYDLINLNTNYDKLFDSVDVIIHLAGMAHVKIKNNIESSLCQDINVTGTKKLIHAAAERNISRFIFLSSIKVNGEQTPGYKSNENQCFKESDVPKPENQYAKSKLEVELYLREECNQFNMDYVILRPSLIFGPYVKANFLNLIKAVDKGWPLPLASIKNLRSFIYIGNLCDVISVCISKAEAKNELYLLSDTAISTPELIKCIAKHLNRRANIFVMPILVLKILGNMIGKSKVIIRLTDSLVIDNMKLKKNLKWSSAYTLDEGMKETIDWYLDRS